ncbi:MAG TPA: MarR family transcriptional regulator, partial [Bacteroidales bacterium]|nr:MarR family transcriptional regulator [Bacteroidales bacterium]
DIPTKLCRSMSNKFIKSILKELEINFSHQHYTILKLLEENKRLYITEFVDILSITKPQMTSLIDKLILLGYVERTNDINDRRKIYLSATKEGKMITSKINKTIDNEVNKYLADLTQIELDALKNGLLVLQKLYLNCNI